MHEFSLARNIVDIAAEQVQNHGASRVELIDIEVGTLSGVVMEALEFAMDEAIKGTVLEHATVYFTKIQAQARCTLCGNIFEMDDFFSVCMSCQSTDFEIIRGKELKVKSLRLDI